MGRALDIALKDLRVWIRDPAAIGILVGMPVVLILILGSALGGVSGGGGAGIKVGVVDLSRGGGAPAGADKPASDELVAALTESERIADLFAIDTLQTERVARARIRDGELVAVLLIPPAFDQDVAYGHATKLVVLKDPGSEMAAGIWQSIVSAMASRFSAASVSVQTVMETAQRGRSAMLAQPGGSAILVGRAVQAVTADDALAGVQVEDVAAAGVVQVTAIDYYGLSMVSMFLMFGAMFGAFSTIKENREQTMDRMLSTPVAREAIVGGKMLSVFLLGMVQFAVLYVFTRFVFGVEWGADPLAVVAVAVAEMLAVTGLATLIASFARSERAAGGIGPLVVQIQALLGGAFFAITVLPEWVQPVRYFSVVGWTMEAWTAVQTRGAHIGDVLLPIAALLGFSALFFAVGVWRTGARR